MDQQACLILRPSAKKEKGKIFDPVSAMQCKIHSDFLKQFFLIKMETNVISEMSCTVFAIFYVTVLNSCEKKLITSANKVMFLVALVRLLEAG